VLKIQKDVADEEKWIKYLMKLCQKRLRGFVFPKPVIGKTLHRIITGSCESAQPHQFFNFAELQN
jgi:hypothetical protein